MDQGKAPFEQLVDVLRLVAAEHAVQLNAMPDFVLVADEIALSLHDIVVFLPQIPEVEGAQQVGEMLEELDELFEVMSIAEPTHQELWTNEALAQHPLWRLARRLARECLAALGEDPAPPMLDFVDWVPSR